jgi:hypothetical protein
VLSQNVDEFFVFVLHQNRTLVQRIFCQVLDAINSHPCKTMLGNWWSPYVSSIVL